MAGLGNGALSLTINLIDNATSKLDKLWNKALQLDGQFSKIGSSFSLGLQTEQVDKFASAFENAMIRADLKAQLLAKGIGLVTDQLSKMGAMATAAYEAAKLDEKQDIQSTSYLFNKGVGAKPGEDATMEGAQAFYQEINNQLAVLAAKLPGTTNDYVKINKGLQDNILPFFQDAETGIVESEGYKKTLIEQTSKIGVLMDASGTSVGQATEFYSRMLQGASSASLRQLEFGMKNVTLMAAYDEVTKKRGVTTLAELSQAQKLAAVQEVMAKSVPPDALDRLTKTADSFKQGFLTQLSDPDVGIFGFARQLKIGDVNSSLFGQLSQLEKTLYSDTDGLYGSLKRLTSSFGITLEAFDPIIPLINAAIAVKSGLQAIVNSINQVSLAKLQGLDPFKAALDQLTGLSSKIAQGLQGAFQTIGATINDWGNKSIGAAKTALDDGFLTKLTTDFAQTMGQGISSATQVFANVDWDNLADVANRFARDTWSGWGKMGISFEQLTANMVKGLEGYGKVWKAGTDGMLLAITQMDLSKLGPKLGESLARMFNSISAITPDLGLLSKVIEQGLSGVGNGIAVALSSLDIGKVLKMAFDQIGAAMSGVTASLDSGALGNLIQAGFDFVSRGVSGLLDGAVALSNPEKLISLITGALFNVFDGVSKGVQSISPSEFFSKIGQVLSNLAQAIGGLFTQIVPKAQELIGNAISNLTNIGSQINSTGISTALAGLAANVGDALLQMGDAALQIFGSVDWSALGAAIMDAPRQISIAIYNGLEMAINAVDWSGLADLGFQLIDGAINGLFEALAGAFFGLIDGQDAKAAETGEAVSGFWGAVWNAVEELGTMVNRLFVKYIVIPIQKVWAAIEDVFILSGEVLAHVLLSGWEGFTNGIKDMWRSLLINVQKMMAWIGGMMESTNIPGLKDKGTEMKAQAEANVSQYEKDYALDVEIRNQTSKDRGKRWEDMKAEKQRSREQLYKDEIELSETNSKGNQRENNEAKQAARQKDAKAKQEKQAQTEARKKSLAQLKAETNQAFDKTSYEKVEGKAINVGDALNPAGIKAYSATQEKEEKAKYSAVKALLDETIRLKGEGKSNDDIAKAIANSAAAKDSKTSAYVAQLVDGIVKAKSDKDFKEMISQISGAKTSDATEDKYGKSFKDQLEEKKFESASKAERAQLQKEQAQAQANLRAGGKIKIEDPNGKIKGRGGVKPQLDGVVESIDENGIATVVRDMGKKVGKNADGTDKIDRTQSSMTGATVYKYDTKKKQVLDTVDAKSSGLTIGNDGLVKRLKPIEMSAKKLESLIDKNKEAYAGLDADSLALRTGEGKQYRGLPDNAKSGKKGKTGASTGGKVYSNGATSYSEYLAGGKKKDENCAEGMKDALGKAIDPNNLATTKNTEATNALTKALDGTGGKLNNAFATGKMTSGSISAEKMEEANASLRKSRAVSESQTYVDGMIAAGSDESGKIDKSWGKDMAQQMSKAAAGLSGNQIKQLQDAFGIVLKPIGSKADALKEIVSTNDSSEWSSEAIKNAKKGVSSKDAALQTLQAASNASKPITDALGNKPASKAAPMSLQNQILSGEFNKSYGTSNKGALGLDAKEGALQALVSASWASNMEGSLAPYTGAGKGFEKYDAQAKKDLAKLAPGQNFDIKGPDGFEKFNKTEGLIKPKQAPITQAAGIMSQKQAQEIAAQKEAKGKPQVSVSGVTVQLNIQGSTNPDETVAIIGNYFDTQFAQALAQVIG